MKYLIAGLGNIGVEYKETRHNVGFQILDTYLDGSGIEFEDKRYAFVAEKKFKGRSLVLIKPTTYMNRSGLAINYWLQKHKIPVDKMLVLVDDLALDFGTLRLKPKGGDGGHNGLANINQTIGGSKYARLRFGIGDNFGRGQQIDYVLGEWNSHEKKLLPELYDKSIKIIEDFCTIGLQLAMTNNNGK